MPIAAGMPNSAMSCTAVYATVLSQTWPPATPSTAMNLAGDEPDGGRGTNMTGPCRRECCPALALGRRQAGPVSAGSKFIPEMAPSAV